MKKVFSVALAMMLTLSLITVGASATSANNFTDKSQIVHDEAVDVLYKIGVINGLPDGSFAPEENVTRSQMAKMVSFILNSGNDIGSMYANVNTFTDCSSNWAKGYIAYAYMSGYVSGIGNNKFDPEGTVTGVQAAKMLLCALGYKADNEGYVGSNWATNVLKDAKDADLLDDMDDVDMSAPLTRDNAAKMMLNALEADTVKYSTSGTTVTTPDGTKVETGASEAEKETNSKSDDYRGSGSADADTVQQMCEKYFDDLTQKNTKTDDFGRPGVTWIWKGDEIGTYSKDDPDYTLVLNKSGQTNYTVLVDDDDFLNLSSDDFAASGINVYINGDKAESNVTYANLMAGSDFQAGDVIECYENDNDLINNIVVVRYTLAKIDDISTSLSSTYTKKNATCSIDLEDLDDCAVGKGTYYDAYDDHDSQVLNGFDANTYTEGTVIAVALKESDNSILTSQVAGVVSGTVSAYKSGSKAALSVDGTSYQLTGTLKDDKNYSSDDFNFNDTTYTTYTDPNNYIIGIEKGEAAAINDVYYVTGIVQDTSNSTYGSANYYAQAVFLKDGSVSSIKLERDAAAVLVGLGVSSSTWENKTDTEKDSAILAAMGVDKNTLDTNVAGLYTFSDSDGSKSDDSKSNNGKFTPDVYDNDSTSTYYIKGSATSTLYEDLKKDDSSMKIVTGSKTDKVYLDSATRFVKVEDTGDNIDVTTVTGGTAVQAVNNKSDTYAIAICTKSGSTYTASYVVLASKDFSTSTDASDVVYVDDVSTTKNSDGWEVELRFMDGTGTVKTCTVDSDKAPAVGFYSYTVDDNDVYSLDNDVNNVCDEITPNTSYDDETGCLTGATLNGLQDNQLSVDSYTYSGKTYDLEDVDLASNVIINDERSKSERNDDAYTSEITTVSMLKKAIEKDGWTVTANVYYDDDNVVMVSVTSMDPCTVASATTNAGTLNGITIDSVTHTDVDINATVTYTVNYHGTASADTTMTFTAGDNSNAPSKDTFEIEKDTAVVDGTITFTVTGVSGNVGAADVSLS